MENENNVNTLYKMRKLGSENSKINILQIIFVVLTTVYLNINLVSDAMLEVSQRHSVTMEKNGALGLKAVV
jgi:hypothetical protein